MRYRVLWLLLLCLLLSACRAAPAGDSPTATAPAVTTATATAEASPTTESPPTATATLEPTEEPQPTPTATVEATDRPEVDIEPHVLARLILEQATPAGPPGWQVEPCEGQAPILCVSDGQQNVGYAELLVNPLSSYDADHPLRVAAGALPADIASYTAEDLALVQETLTALAEEHLEVIREDRAITYPDDTFTPLPQEPAQLGPLPAVSFGFVHTDPAGEVVERYLYVAAFDQDFVYWFGAQYDPANVTTFVSDETVLAFAPFFVEMAAGLPLYAVELPF